MSKRVSMLEACYRDREGRPIRSFLYGLGTSISYLLQGYSFVSQSLPSFQERRRLRLEA